MTVPDRPLRVIVLTLSFGSGHVRAAHAVAQALRQQAPDADVRVMDALDGCRFLFRAVYVWPYWAMVRYVPALWRRLFMARLRRRHARTAPAWAFRFGCPHVFAAITDFDPQVIVATEVAACEIADIARRRKLTNGSIVNVITDHHAEPAWVKPSVSAYAVPDADVSEQLRTWGAPAERIVVCGIPTAISFQSRSDSAAVRRRHGAMDDRPLVLLMAGGMGPSRMDLIARELCASDQPMHVVAIAGHDRAVRRRLSRVRGNERTTLTVYGWSDDVAALMQSASVLVTKPGGVTAAEAALAGVPVVLFEGIPGPEEHNATRAVERGGSILTRGGANTAAAVLSLLRNDEQRRAMTERAREVAVPSAATAIARLILAARDERAIDPPPQVLILTIRNGAGHTQVAHAIADALSATDAALAVSVIDVADYMTWFARTTHVTIFLWLVRHVPRVWERIDRFQKRRQHTSPEWYYRRGCRRLFNLVRELRPVAMLATEVGCCEIASLIKRDLGLTCPLIAVNGEYDSDRAWVQPGVTLYSAPDEAALNELCAHGAERGRARAWGVPLAAQFLSSERRNDARASVCARLGLTPDQPVILVSGGSEGLGRPDAVAERLLHLSGVAPQVVVLAGRNEKLRQRCAALARGSAATRLRVLGWTTGMRELMEAGDLLVSKLGHTFDEAVATALPLVALEPPPGSERVQYRLLEEWGVGRAVRDLDELADVVERLLAQPAALAAMRRAAASRQRTDAAVRIARWIVDGAGTRARRSVA